MTEICGRPGCGGTIAGGYCRTCGFPPGGPPDFDDDDDAGADTGALTDAHAERVTSAVELERGAAADVEADTTREDAMYTTDLVAVGEDAKLDATRPSGLASPPTTGRQRTPSTRTTASPRTRLGAGLVEVPPIESRDPAEVIMAVPTLAEHRRFCSRCGSPVGRTRDGVPGTTEGVCESCGTLFSFSPKLATGDVVAGQYEVVGCLAHGGMGWIYLARDRRVSDRWVVLKGLLDTSDETAMAAALAERRFLAEVEHPNIVKIHNFVEHDGSGYIVMEYVGGTSLEQIMADRRRANGGEPDPLPVAHAIAYMLEILPALGYLHRSGLLLCDFKPANVIQDQHSLKLIDLGGIHRMAERATSVYGTVGYQAPELGELGPSVASDLFTVGRTLATLCFSFEGFQTTHRYTLPDPDEVAVLRENDSLYRFLLKATAPSRDDRFQSAEEMAEQLHGILREVIAAQDGTPVPARSSLFTSDFRASADEPDWRKLPLLQVDGDDPAAGYLAGLAGRAPAEVVELLRASPEHTVEVDLRLVRSLIDAGESERATDVITRIEADDPWDWRATWYRGVMALALERWEEADEYFAAVYAFVPGELAPKLARGVALEQAGSYAEAAHWYEIVARTDDAFTTATFGLARCRLAMGDREGATRAYCRVPETSSAYLDAQTARIRCLLGDGTSGPSLEELRTADAVLRETRELGAEQTAALRAALFDAALGAIERRAVHEDPTLRLAGHRLTRRDLRLGIERSYRSLARLAPTPEERIRLVDRANRMRPRTWF